MGMGVIIPNRKGLSMRKFAISLIFISVVVVGCGAGKCDKVLYVEQSWPKIEHFQEVMNIAADTQVSNLPGPIADLQEITRETEKLEIDSSCNEILDAHDNLVKGMDNVTEGFIAFMDGENDAVFSSLMDTGANYFSLYAETVNEWALKELIADE